ncbi:hypothetical protein SARC_01389 [Sphaeroforma arctica JP610]|uniref:Uncharacterized protein n=1 Tax=Sphaeroforma arctica JP610 TaxID=667725 RepID=A0A0L0GC47_9EUKA|nr:hypothetical protein SARC_01389 [Sphaeroforma arctica JP610]KNC86481.1 hypothetical protein SARC_01389 [Sphaeroforma arctica JP610]|eukprot:XP_014160383.1 hypothetical protein SARC_01389 [Sphaeroforma arctica JP610]
MSVVGFDVGNLNSTISAARAGGIEVLANEYTYRMTPTIVSFGQKMRFMGEAARPQLTTNFKNTVSQVKRLIGMLYDDEDVQTELANVPYKHSRREDGRINLTVIFKGEERNFTPEQVYAMFLTQLKQTAERELKKPVVDIVVSCPNWFNNFQREAILHATNYAGLNCVRVLNDTTATALAYGIYKQDLDEEKPRHVVFVDMGHSSLQVAVCTFLKGKFSVLATGADTKLGGRDFDQLIYEKFRLEFLAKSKIDLNEKPRGKARLMGECEKVKKLMSANQQPIPINVECVTDDADFHSKMSREEFYEMAKPLFDRVQGPIEQALMDSKLSLQEIHSVEIIGGSTRIPKIKEIISGIFGENRMLTTLNADESTSRGCALMAAILSPTFRVREFSVTDSTPYPIDLKWKINDEPSTAVVFERHNPIPSTKMLKFKRSEPFELAAYYNDPLNVPGERKFIGRYRVDDVKPDSEGNPIQAKVRVRCNKNGMFSVESAHWVEEILVPEEPVAPATPEPMAEDGKEGDEEKAADTPAEPTEPAEPKFKKVQQTHALKVVALDTASKEELSKNLEVEMELTMSDKQERQRVDSKNALEEFVYEVREKMDTVFSKNIEDDRKERVSAELMAIEDWLYDEGDDVQRSEYVTRMEKLEAEIAPVKSRARDWENLPAAEEAIRRSIVQYRKVVDQYPNDEKYNHIAAEKIQAIKEVIDEKDSWFNTNIAANKGLTPKQDPVVTPAQVTEARMAIEKVSIPILKTPKPKAPTPEPTAVPEPAAAPEAEKKDEAVPDATPTESENMEVD